MNTEFAREERSSKVEGSAEKKIEIPYYPSFSREVAKGRVHPARASFVGNSLKW